MTPLEKQFSAVCKQRGLIKKVVIQRFMESFIEEGKPPKIKTPAKNLTSLEELLKNKI